MWLHINKDCDTSLEKQVTVGTNLTDTDDAIIVKSHDFEKPGQFLVIKGSHYKFERQEVL